MQKVLSTIRKLRRPGGCPWDRKQTLRSLRRCLLEESYEAIDAIDRSDASGLKEELGDLLCVIATLTDIAEEKGKFNFNGVSDGLIKKLIRRHPHVFGNHKVSNAAEALEAWNKVKTAESKNSKTGKIQNISRSFPSLLVAEKLGKHAARKGFDWQSPADILPKVKEEVQELEKALRGRKREQIEEELGDLLFSIAQLSRKLHIDSEIALHRAGKKFQKRFIFLEKLAAKKHGVSLDKLSNTQLEKLWERAKCL